MKEYFDLKILKNAELILRCTMSITLLVAGISKFFSDGGFYRYYVQEFAKKIYALISPHLYSKVILV